MIDFNQSQQTQWPIAWTASMISCTDFALGLFAGAVADSIGQRRVLILGLFAMTAGSLLGAFAQSGEVILVSRFIGGLGFTAVTITGVGIITHVTAASDRKWALEVWSSLERRVLVDGLFGGGRRRPRDTLTETGAVCQCDPIYSIVL